MRRLFLILTVFVCTMHGAAQNMRSLFLNAPEEVFPLLTGNNRADCVDYIEAGMKAFAVNRLGGTSYLRELAADYFYLDTSGSSWVEAMLLPFGSDSIICMVKGVKAEAADSRLLFYDREWNPLSVAQYLQEPEVTEFFISPDSAGLYAEKCDIYLVKYSLSPKDASLKAEYTMPSYMNVDEAAALQPLLRPVSYKWNGRRFVKE